MMKSLRISVATIAVTTAVAPIYGEPAPTVPGANVQEKAKSEKPAAMGTVPFVPGAGVVTAAIAGAAPAKRVSANTASGYCIETPPGYVGTGTADAPFITPSMPRCTQSQLKQRR